MEEITLARDKAESELLTMARRVATLEQQLMDAQRSQDDMFTDVASKVDQSTRIDKDEIEKLKARCDELEAARDDAVRGVERLSAEAGASRSALAEAQKVAAEAENVRAELNSRIEAAEIRVMNANALADASKNALEEYKRKSTESTRVVQDALQAERDAAMTAASAAERDRDAWSEKCAEARDTLERWREKARKLMADKDAELELARGAASPARSKSRLFDDDAEDASDEVGIQSTSGAGVNAPTRVDDVHAEYLAAVVKRFLLLPYDAYDRADALVPVICTILGFGKEDEFRIRAHRASQRVKSSSSKFLGGVFG
jgi:chromosome segregation ATPase